MKVKNEKNNLSSQKYWNDYYSQQNNFIRNRNQVTAWLENEFKKIDPKGSCFEIGCYPGTYLSVFGEMGLELNGIDLTPRTQDLKNQLEDLNYKVGDIYNGNFFIFKTERKFNVVCSFGFIEHFKNWKKVLDLQKNLVDSGGYIVVEVPNFYGFFQRFLHFWFDRRNYKRHHRGAMSLKKLENLLLKDFDIIYSGCFYGFDFWVDKEQRGVFQNYLLDKIGFFLPLLKKYLNKNNKNYSPYCGIIARKKNDATNK